MAKLVGYARVSTDKQSDALQIDALNKLGCGHIFTEQLSGVSMHRPEFLRALKILSPGDTFVVWKIDRASRSMTELSQLMDHFRRKGIFFRSITEGMDTSTNSGLLVFNIMGSLAQFERGNIVERMKAGIAAHRKRGDTWGRPNKISPGMIEVARQKMAEGYTIAEAAKFLRVGVSTLYRYILKADKEALNDIFK